MQQFIEQKFIYAWIFLSTVLASQKVPTQFSGISMIADGINHAVPTHKELQISLTWLINHDLVCKQGKKYSVSAKGIQEYEEASKDTKILNTILHNLVNQFNNYK